MPTTLTGLLLFVVLLLPGFAYLVGKERAGTERRASPFRETVAVVAASIAAELVVVLIVAPLWTRYVDFDRLVREPGQYWSSSPALLAGWAVGLLLGATVLASATTWPTVRHLPLRVLPERMRNKPQFTYPHPSSVSGWWMLFEHYHRDRPKHVGLMLDDGSFVAGTQLSFNNDASDTPDRDIILVPPITYRAAGEDEARPYPTSMVCVSARRIVAMFVSVVLSTESPTAPEVPEAAEVEPMRLTDLLLSWWRGRRRWRRQHRDE
jgi:hypothetical protein